MVGLSEYLTIHALKILAGQLTITFQEKHLTQIEPGLIANLRRKCATRAVTTEQFREQFAGLTGHAPGQHQPTLYQSRVITMSFDTALLTGNRQLGQSLKDIALMILIQSPTVPKVLRPLRPGLIGLGRSNHRQP